MPPDDSYAQGVREIEQLRARLAHLEEVARMPRAGLEDAIADHYSPTQPVDPARRRLEAEARQFVPDPASEDALAARDRDPVAFDASMAAMHVSGLPLALYGRMRAAAVETDTWTPPTKEGASK
jgi:hypothetical protein